MVLMRVRYYNVVQNAVHVVIEITFDERYALLPRTAVDKHFGFTRLYKGAITRILVAEFDKMYRKVGVFHRYNAVRNIAQIVVSVRFGQFVGRNVCRKAVFRYKQRGDKPARKSDCRGYHR